jgi:hypothetical protein
MMNSASNQDAPAPAATLPAGVDVQWETETRVIWNEREQVVEKQELIYEVSWILELGVWRCFLRSRRNVQNRTTSIGQSSCQLG